MASKSLMPVGTFFILVFPFISNVDITMGNIAFLAPEALTKISLCFIIFHYIDR